jgi:hypothetical protein
MYEIFFDRRPSAHACAQQKNRCRGIEGTIRLCWEGVKYLSRLLAGSMFGGHWIENRKTFTKKKKRKVAIQIN